MESWVGAKNLVFGSRYNEHILFRNLQKRFLAYQEHDTLQTRYPLWSGFPYYNVTTSLGKAPQSDTWERTQQLYGFQPCMRTFTGTQFMTKKHTYTFVGTLLQKLYSFLLVPTHLYRSWLTKEINHGEIYPFNWIPTANIPFLIQRSLSVKHKLLKN